MTSPQAPTMHKTDATRAQALQNILEAAAKPALPLCGRITPLALKSDDSPVTQADMDAERVILDALQKIWPGEAIHSEESGRIGTFSEEQPWWVVDPIDGTSAFAEGLAHWGPTVARILPSGKIDIGAIYLPRLGEFYLVENGRASLNGQPLPMLADTRVANVVYLPSRFHKYGRLNYRGKGRCLGGSAAHLAGVARGAAELAIIAPGWTLWDTAAGIGLIEAVGGRLVRYDGAGFDPIRDEGAAFIAGKSETVEDFILHQRVAI